jgi:hypothetical protein
MRLTLAVALSSLVAACFPAASPVDPRSDVQAASDAGGVPDAPQPGDGAEASDTSEAGDGSGTGDTSEGGDTDPGTDVVGGDDTTTPSDEIPLERLAAAYGEVYCAYLARCEATPGSDALLRLFARASPAGCARWLAVRFEVEVVPDIEAGAVAYDGFAAARCLRSLERGCEGDLEGGADCAVVLIGQRQVSEACSDGQSCSPGLYCETGDPSYCGGTCAVSPKLGEACRGGTPCSQVEGRAECDWERGICVPRAEPVEAAAGEACGMGALPDQPRTPVVCPSGHACWKLPSEERATCQPWLSVGAPCTRGVCPVGTICRTTSTTARPSCERMAVFNEVGKPCNESTEGTAPIAWCNPFARLICGAEGVCGEATGEEGSACSELVPCQRGLACGSEGRCAALLRDGAACRTHDVCASGLCFEGACKTPSCAL